MNKLEKGISILLDMVCDWKFIIFVLGSAMAYSQQSPELLWAAAAGYLGIKTYIDASITANSPVGEDYTYEWTTIPKLNSLLNKVIFSSRAWICIITGALAYQLGDIEMVRNIGLTWAGILGAGEGTINFLKNVDLSKFKVDKTTNIELPNEVTITVDNIDNYIPPKLMPMDRPVPTFPDFQPFDVDSWIERVKAKCLSSFGELTATGMYRSLVSLGAETVCYYSANIVKYAKLKYEMSRNQFKSAFGFDYENRNNPDSLTSLKGYCGEVPASFDNYLNFMDTAGSLRWQQDALQEIERCTREIDAASKLEDKNNEIKIDRLLQDYSIQYVDEKGKPAQRIILKEHSYQKALYALSTDWKTILS